MNGRLMLRAVRADRDGLRHAAAPAAAPAPTGGIVEWTLHLALAH